MGTGKVVTSGSRLNVRTGAGMNYEIIDQLRPSEETVHFLNQVDEADLCKQDRLDAWGNLRVAFT